MIIPCCRLGAGGDQENVMFCALGVTVKLCGGPVGAREIRVLVFEGHQIWHMVASLLLQTTTINFLRNLIKTSLPAGHVAYA